MEKEKVKGIIEAILFASARIVSLDELVLSLEIDKDEISKIIEEMKEEYKKDNRGIELISINNGYTLASKKKLHEYIYQIIDKRVKPNLSQAALEVLAIIAYNPRISRAEIENIRGVNSDASLYRLMEHNLVQEAGKLDLPGKPMSYEVTEEFLKKFGLNTLKDLPELPKYKVDENQQIVIDDLITLEGQKENDEESKEQDEKEILNKEEKAVTEGE